MVGECKKKQSTQSKITTRLQDQYDRFPLLIELLLSGLIQGAEEEMQFVQRTAENDIIYLLGESKVVAMQKSSAFKKVIVSMPTTS